MTTPRSNAAIDQNRNTSLIGVSTADGLTPVAAEVDPLTGQLQVAGNLFVSSSARGSISDQNTTITSSTSATTIVSAIAATYCDLLSLVLTNTSSTGSEVQLFNDDGTTIRNVFYVPPTDTRGIVFSEPFMAAASNVTWKLKTVTSIASLKITAQFIKNT
jgi:hypothetical protein